MRRVLGLVALIVCTLLGSATAALGDVTTNVSQTLDSVVFVPCAAGGAGEVVDLTGDLHVLTTLSINGTMASGMEHFQPQGVRGVGETTGDVFQGTGVTREHFSLNLVDGRGETSFVDSFNIIGHGGSVNYRVRQVSHVTVSADGTVTVTHDQFSVDCG